MLKTKEKIRAYILDYLKDLKICRISAINCKCKNETMLFNVLNEMVNNGEIEKDSTFIQLPKN